MEDFEFFKQKDTFLNLPKDVFDVILSYLPLKDLLKLERLNHETKYHIQTNQLWKDLLFSVYPDTRDYITKNFKHIYCQTHQKIGNLESNHFRVSSKKFTSKNSRWKSRNW